MTKRSTRSNSTTDKEPARPRNRRAQKHSKADSSDATTDSNGPKIVEKHMNGLNLGDKTNASTAEVKDGDVCGGRLLWSNLVAPSNSKGLNIDKQIRDSLAPYNMFDKFKEGDGLHDLASLGKNSRRVTGKGQVLTSEGWRLLFQEFIKKAPISPRALKEVNSVFLASGLP
jgi:hypothetical protein